jgi:hypothetical protein
VSGALTLNLERVRQNRAARQAAIDATRGNAPAAADRRGAQYLRGDVVFDRVTGETGVVVDARRENLVVPTPRG